MGFLHDRVVKRLNSYLTPVVVEGSFDRVVDVWTAAVAAVKTHFDGKAGQIVRFWAAKLGITDGVVRTMSDDKLAEALRRAYMAGRVPPVRLDECEGDKEG